MPIIDEHHCNCLFVDDGIQARKFYLRLKKLGAYDQILQENHGQKWALTLALDDFWQLHIKMMPNYHIESEVEARIIFKEHHTIRSRPAHQELRQLLEQCEIVWGFILPTPEPCKSRLLNTSNNSTDITNIALAFGIMAIGIAALVLVLYLYSKRKEAQ